MPNSYSGPPIKGNWTGTGFNVQGGETGIGIGGQNLYLASPPPTPPAGYKCPPEGCLCTPGQFPPGTNLDTHYMDTTARCSEPCDCPVYPRLIPCTQGHFPPGTSLDTHYMDTTVKCENPCDCPVYPRETPTPTPNPTPTYAGFVDSKNLEKMYNLI